LKSKLSQLLNILSLTLALSISAAAQSPATSQYFYDDKGRLVKVVDSSGNVVEYVYDAAGNIAEVRRSTVGTTLSIFNFTPQRGAPRTRVTISGQGFSPVASSNAVRFNGLAVEVVSAASNRLVVNVPIGAETGPITVTVGGATAQTDRDFTILPAPIITSVSPRFVVRPPALTLSLHVNGFNLTGASYSFLLNHPPQIDVTAVTTDPAGTSATLSLNLSADATGTFALVAANQYGTSDPSFSAANILTIVAPGTADVDGDGLNNDDETQRGTDPANPDTDGDGFLDGLEVQLGSDPLSASSVPNVTPEREAFGATFSVLNVVVPSGPGAEAGEAVSQVWSVKNLVSPSAPGSEAAEAVGPVFSVKNSTVPQGAEAKESVGLVFSVKNLIVPQGAEAQEAVGPVFSLKNLVAPAGFEPGEAVGPVFSIVNQTLPSGPGAEPGEAVGPVFSVRNLFSASAQAGAPESCRERSVLCNQAILSVFPRVRIDVQPCLLR